MIYEEFICYNKGFSADKNDFYGAQSPWTFSQQKEFLKAYLADYKKRYGEDCLYEKAVSEQEIDEAVTKIEKSSDFFAAYKKKRSGIYKGWQFYTDRAVLEKGVLCFRDDYTFPVPCAKYEFTEGLRHFSFRFKIDGAYFHKSAEGILPTTTGRWVEIRQGCREIVKLYFSPDGQIFIKDGRKKPYHYDLCKIGDYAFDEWRTLSLTFEKTAVSVEYNGERSSYPYTTEAVPDTLFFSGGMQPVGQWFVEPLCFENGKGEQKSLFAPNIDAQEECEEALGQVTLPYALGTEQNKDCWLLLKKKFTAEKGLCYALECGALDPGGNVYVNGELVKHTDGFQPFYEDITAYVKEGENELVLEIEPRAPEVLYPWHRHNDYYNAWFALETHIHTSKIANTAEPKIATAQVGENTSFTFDWDIKTDRTCNYRIYLQKCYPERGERQLLVEKPLIGSQIHEEFCLPLELWNVDAPVLYKITTELFDGLESLLTVETETGFRTVEQRHGSIYINGKKCILKGALNMQFLPPYEHIPVSHMCPSDREIVEQVLALKNMNGNCMRMHQLGYGCNDRRFARICDRLGIFLIWTTRLIDSAENMMWTETWAQKEAYQEQMRYVQNSPSIIMWEGSNELHADRKTLDTLYDEFVTAVEEVDTTRLMSPVSHLYYGGGIYDLGCEYYDTAGERSEQLLEAHSSFGWKAEKVVRSAHTYSLLLGYGAPWRDMATQNWRLQQELFDEPQKAYLVSEYAIIGRQNPNTAEAKTFINKDSYEFPDEVRALGENFTEDEWELSQAFQALCAKVATKQLWRFGADGMLWCCLWGGANNASYLKPIVDFYGYKKAAYYALRECFENTLCFNEKSDVLWYDGYEVVPMACGLDVGGRYALSVEIFAENGKKIIEKEYPDWFADAERMQLKPFTPVLENGYYKIKYILTKKD